MHNRPALFSALTAAFLTIGYSILWFEGDERFYRLWYYVPAAALAGSLIADRLGIWRMMTPWQWIIDLAVLMLCAARPWFGFPPVSGHAVFSLHAIMTGRSVSTRVLAIASLLITLFAKIVLWGFDCTLWPGLALGVLSGWWWKFAAPGPSEKLTKHSEE